MNNLYSFQDNSSGPIPDPNIYQHFSHAQDTSIGSMNSISSSKPKSKAAKKDSGDEPDSSGKRRRVQRACDVSRGGYHQHYERMIE